MTLLSISGENGGVRSWWRTKRYIKNYLAAKGFTADRRCLAIIRDLEQKQREDLVRCLDIVGHKKLGIVRIILPGNDRIKDADFSQIPGNRLVVQNGILNFEEIFKFLELEQLSTDEPSPTAATRQGRFAVPAAPTLVLWSDLSKFANLVEPHWFYDRINGGRRPVMIMDLRNLSSSGAPASLLGELAITMGLLTRNAWKINVHRPVRGYSAEHIRQRFIAASRIFLAGVEMEEGVEIVGFSVVNELRDPRLDLETKALMYEVSMVEQKFQGMGITSFMVGQMFTDALFENNLRRVLVAARTANPQAMGGLQILGRSFPGPGSRKPTAEQIKLFKYASAQLSPGRPADPKTFVVQGAFALSDGLVAPPHLIPKHSDRQINKLCARLMQYDRFNSALFFDGELAPGELARLTRELHEENLTESRINRRLLEEPRLYERLKERLSPGKISPGLLELAEHTEQTRAQEFSALDLDERENIRVLNRLLLEEIFPWLPKRRANAAIVIGEISLLAKFWFTLKQLKKNILKRMLSLVHCWIVNDASSK